MAEAVLKHQITQRTSLQGKLDIRVDSAGTGAYHAGDDADERTIETCRRVRHDTTYYAGI
jgi:low molecular weight phosphotyrosine protein phosphatase